MKKFLYPRLALQGIFKNKKLYIPYIISCIGSVMMFCIIQNLSYSPTIEKMSGGSQMGLILGIGKFVIAFFSLIFLFYTSSFLTKTRYKEFGLYSVLGMNKKGISKIVLYESLFISLIGLFGGMLSGLAFSKLAELCLINVIGGVINYDLPFSLLAFKYTFGLFGTIFLLLMIKSLIDVNKLNPLDLLKSEHYGEKPIKANFFLAFIGLVILAIAYYMAISIESPLTAIITFFIAVILVIIATYILFISGSVALCKLAQSNKKYYYKKEHFISISSMAYRMKKNGAGLASICILSTMVLVIISSTSSLYFGGEDALKSRYPRNSVINMNVYSIQDLSNEGIKQIDNSIYEVFDNYNYDVKNEVKYRYLDISGSQNNNSFNPEAGTETALLNYDNVRTLYFIDIEDYNRIMNSDYDLNGNEVFIYPRNCKYDLDKIIIKDLELKVKGKTNFSSDVGNFGVSLPSIVVVVSDLNILEPLENLTINNEKMLTMTYTYMYDSSFDSLTSANMYNDVATNIINNCNSDEKSIMWLNGGTLDESKDDFIKISGSLFFLGIILSILFICAAAVIIYYKQISEGYEDKNRFAIMMKVGLSKEDIKKSIDSEVLSVFFAPLIVAGIHLAFSFKYMWLLLQVFNLSNIKVVITTTIIAYLCFCLFYIFIYKLTAKEYYNIVSNDDNKA